MLNTNWLIPDRRFESSISELMDNDAISMDALKADLKNLGNLNRYFGSYSLVRSFLYRWFGDRSRLRKQARVTILDLCTGCGDIPRLIADWFKFRSFAVSITAIDAQSKTLALAKEQSKSYPEIEYIHSDVFGFLQGKGFDYVLCSLALHHFADLDAVRLLALANKTARRGILFADLERTDLGILGVDFITATMFRQPVTRFDARLSIRRAFSFCEMRRLAKAAGWQGFGHARFFACRQAIWLESKD